VLLAGIVFQVIRLPHTLETLWAKRFQLPGEPLLPHLIRLPAVFVKTGGAVRSTASGSFFRMPQKFKARKSDILL
jgi:hypothetical protein